MNKAMDSGRGVSAGMHIVMVASENGALPGGKVGGIGDVIRDLPGELAARGHTVTILNPGYQFLPRMARACFLSTLQLEFAGGVESVAVYEAESTTAVPGVRMLLLDHPLFGSGGEALIYHHDRDEPFATDARTFALFCQAVCAALVNGIVAPPDVLHLHDWHAAMLLVLRACHPAWRRLQSLRCVFTIHNLSLQGIRPFAGSWSSPAVWFPELQLPRQDLVDPRYPDCMNLMRAGIRLADRVHVVSPTYAREVQLPSEPAQGLVRGEGLEQDLRQADREGRLSGILNGCEYPAGRKQRVTQRQFITAALAVLEEWTHDRLWIRTATLRAMQRLQQWQQRQRKPAPVVASVGRLTAQKVRLLVLPDAAGRPALEAMLDRLGSGVMIVLGSGDEHYERFLLDVMARHDNFLFLNGFSEAMADVVYRFCDLFLMPSSFEPCGISQMLAMRAGTPCLVHRVGGLADTVSHLHNGFSFEGEGLQQQVDAMLATFGEALQLYAGQRSLWHDICRNAAMTRFSWQGVVGEYEQKLYGNFAPVSAA